jgi:hypothetical protein
LVKEHQKIDLPTVDEIQFTEMIETEAEDLIIAYSEH